MDSSLLSLTYDWNCVGLPSTFDTKTMDHAKMELLQGTLDMLILKVLNRGPMHGFGIAQRILQLSDEALSVGESSL